MTAASVMLMTLFISGIKNRRIYWNYLSEKIRRARFISILRARGLRLIHTRCSEKISYGRLDLAARDSATSSKEKRENFAERDVDRVLRKREGKKERKKVKKECQQPDSNKRPLHIVEILDTSATLYH